MSSDHSTDDLNLNELVGNLLAAHNEELEHADIPIPNSEQHSEELPPQEEHDNQVGGTSSHNDNEHTADMDFGDEDLAAVVADAIEGIDYSNRERLNEQPQIDESSHEQPQGGNKEDYQDGVSHTTQSKEEEWAQILQQGILAVDQEAQGNTQQIQEEHLDQDDEHLRRAILDSLHQLDQEETHQDQQEHKSTQSKDKKQSKKSSKKKSQKKELQKKSKKSSSKKDKSHQKQRHSQQGADDDILNFEDVIKGFMEQSGDNAVDMNNTTTSHQTNSFTNQDMGDMEAQALVEATLRAFESELMGSEPTSKKSSSKKKSSTIGKSKKKATSEKKAAQAKVKSAKTTTSTTSKAKSKSSDSPKKKKKSAKKQEQQSDAYIEDDFSKALAEMVNQVVNTSLTDPHDPILSSSTQQQEQHQSHSEPHQLQLQQQPLPNSLSQGSSDSPNTDMGFDLNQIMQNAMAMAFQDQMQDQLDPSVVEDFNRELGMNVSDLLDSATDTSRKKKQHATKKKSADKVTAVKTKKSNKKAKEQEPKRKSEIIPVSVSNEKELVQPSLVIPTSKKLAKVAPRPKKPIKPQPSPEEVLKRKYATVASAAASEARKIIAKKNKEERLKLKEQRQHARETSRRKKEEERKRQEAERKELEEIVAKGPPYPPDLKVTKSGKPKKPYRRYTQEEMARRASMPAEELGKPKKVKKERKKKEKKLKRIPLATLKKIPLFNFSKKSVPFDVRNKLNDIDGTIAKIPLKSARAAFDGDKSSSSSTPIPIPKSANDEKRKKRSREKKLKKASEFDPNKKTVIHREKIPFHPPWTLPSYPPLALPVARRRKKEKKLEDSRKRSKNYRISKKKSQPLTLNAGNRIISASLFPIINTLKAAARARAAVTGASPEESNRQLSAIIQQARLTIAQTLAVARGQSGRDYSSIRTQDDIRKLQQKDNNAKRIPIFSLAKIKGVNTNDNASSVPKKQHDSDGKSSTLPAKRLASSAHSSAQVHNMKLMPTIKLQDSVDETFVPAAVTKIPIAEIAPVEFKVDSTQEENKGKKEGEKSNVPSDERTSTILPSAIKDSPESHAAIAQIVTKVPLSDPAPVKVPLDEKTVSFKSQVKKEKEDTVPNNSNNALSDSYQIENTSAAVKNVQQHEKEYEGLRVGLDGGEKNIGNEGNKGKETFGLEKVTEKTKGGEISALSEPTKPSADSAGGPQVQSIVENLVKHQLLQSHGGNAELPSNLSSIISDTISTLIPNLELDGDVKPLMKRKYTKKKQQVLNLDGLVPPGTHMMKLEPKEPSELLKEATPLNQSSSEASKDRSNLPDRSNKPAPPRMDKRRRSTIDSQPVFNFNIPSKDANGNPLRSMSIMRRVKKHLTSDDFNKLRKDVNNERKRKWREANEKKNKDNDLRARLKKRATILYGESESSEKQKWFEEEYARRKVKLEDSLSETTPNKTSDEPTTNITDVEVLNMIAISLGKIEIARAIEKEIIDEASGLKPEKKTTRKRKDTSMPNTRSGTPLQNSTPERSVSLLEKDNEGMPTANTLVAENRDHKPKPDLVIKPSDHLTISSIDPELLGSLKRLREHSDGSQEPVLKKQSVNDPTEGINPVSPAPSKGTIGSKPLLSGTERTEQNEDISEKTILPVKKTVSTIFKRPNYIGTWSKKK